MSKTLADLTDAEYENFLKNHALLTNQEISQLKLNFDRFRKRKLHPAPIRKKKKNEENRI